MDYRAARRLGLITMTAPAVIVTNDQVVLGVPGYVHVPSGADSLEVGDHLDRCHHRAQVICRRLTLDDQVAAGVIQRHFHLVDFDVGFTSPTTEYHWFGENS